MKKSFSLLLCSVFLLAAVAVQADDWKIVEGKIVSRFAKDLDPKNPLPEYPRPQMERETWLNLNGLWDYAIVGRDAKTAEKYDGKILVPFPIESALSGVGKTVGKDKTLVYNRKFSVPKDEKWAGKRVLLHFGAVDWETTVFVNGKEVGKHTGGYVPFSFDITDVLNAEGEQELNVAVWDPTTDSHQPIGKQHNNPHGIWYTPVTGIWDTVWLEAVPQTYIEKIKLIPSIDDETLTIETTVKNPQKGNQIEAKSEFRETSTKQVPRNIGPFGRRGSRTVQQTTVEKLEPAAAWVGDKLVLKVPKPKLWTPDDPNLYDLDVLLVDEAGKVVDSVQSYFGMRDIKLGKDEKGITRMMLNGKFVFQHGPLDQGWWPDGLYTAPTDEALAYDIVVTKKLGYNMLRKHVKVEPMRFYEHCDRLGMLVWQDMPSGDPRHYIGGDSPDANRSQESKDNFEKEWKEIIDVLYNVPSIVVWVPFNEGWGQFDTCRILDWTKQLDPTRLVDGPSGWTDRGCGDMHDMHAYRGPGMFPAEENRASVLGEYGGLGLPISGHTWIESDKNWGYGGNLKDRDDLLQTYMQLNARMHPMIAEGLSAAVYTQTTDVEVEVNGLMTYDREIIKVDVEKFKASNDALRYPAPEKKVVVPTARKQESEWAYTTEKPADGWEKSDFDDNSWKKGKSGFGTEKTPNSTVRTTWDSSDIWLRKTVELSAEDVKDPSQLFLDLYHDEDAEIYINGEKVLEVKGYVADYATFPLAKAGKSLKEGKNVIAIHCHQTMGGQYIDAGVSRIVPSDKPKQKVW